MISIIVPAYNEEEGIRKTINRLKKIKFKEKSEIIIVDDGSKDGTYKEAKKTHGVKILKHDTNRGKAAALNTGFNAAKGDVVATTDADCTYPPEPIPRMLKLIRSGEADLVLGSRFFHKKRGAHVLLGAFAQTASSIFGRKIKDHTHFFGNAIFSSMISFLANKRITDGSTGLRIFRKGILEKMSIKSKGLDWEVEMTMRSLRAGFKVKEISIDYYPRVGEAKLRPPKDGTRFFFSIVRGRLF